MTSQFDIDSASISPTNGHNVPSSTGDHRQDTVQAIVNIVQQCVELLQSLASDELYTKESVMVPKSTIGKHVRHLAEHFRLLFVGWPSPPSCKANTKNEVWRVNYDNRDHDAPMERSREAAIEALRKIQSRLEDILSSDIQLDTPVCVDTVIDPRAEGTTPFSSTFGREVWAVCHHAIHHYAIIKVICIENNIQTSHDFGIAPSTLRDHNKYAR